jgi:DNA-binding SARP family transcriptional activator
LSAAEERLGDLLLERGDRAAAVDAYRKAKAAAEAVLAGDPSDSSASRRRQDVTRKLMNSQGTPR